MDKHAFLIEAHCNEKQLKKLLYCLDYELNDIYLHIDAKSTDLESINHFSLQKSTLVIVPSVKVSWGGYSQIDAELRLLEAATENGNYTRYHLISGMDLPLVSQQKMHYFFDLNNHSEFVHFDYSYTPDLFRNRMGLYHLCRDKLTRNQKLLENFERFTLVVQKIFGVNRIRSFSMELGKGANWFSISDDCARYVLKKKKWIEETFRFTKCCDEVFLQTIILNSPFKKKLFYDEREKRFGNMRLVDWKRGNPYIFRKEDFDTIISSGYMFGRKFDERVDDTIINLIVDFVTKDKYKEK